MAQVQKSRTATASLADFETGIDDGASDKPENENAPKRIKYWDANEENCIGKILRGESRGVDRAEISKLLKNSEAICLYRFASNYGGKKCRGVVFGGICLHHWNQMGLSFTPLNGEVLDNVETGTSRTIVNHIAPYFMTVHGVGQFCIAPIVRSLRYADWCTDKDKLASLVSSTYTLTSSKEEAAAMSRGLLTLIFGHSPDILTIRSSWLGIQKQLARTLDPYNTYQLIIDDDTIDVEMIKSDLLSIYDSPMLLALPAASLMISNREASLSDKGNITMIQSAGSKMIGTFAIVGPIAKAPSLKRVFEDTDKKTEKFQMDPFPKQHLLTASSLGGVTLSPKQTLIPMRLSQSTVYVMNISENKSFSNEYWDSMGCNALTPGNFGSLKIKRAKYDESDKSVSNDGVDTEMEQTGHTSFNLDDLQNMAE